MSETTAFTIDGEEGSTDRLSIPTGLLEMLRTGEESSAEIVGDLAMLTCAQQIHAIAHHTEGEPDEELVAVEKRTMELFEERFGASYEEVTGHAH
ncbi:DUF7545 family protein [Natronorarus salvus]|uniref:DUF7545 family protein n=1 Tax=Natronorarus salvus TaxID=3117733 RepID=UPI002F269DA1